MFKCKTGGLEYIRGNPLSIVVRDIDCFKMPTLFFKNIIPIEIILKWTSFTPWLQLFHRYYLELKYDKNITQC